MPSSPPKITILTCVWNNRPYIAQTIESVLNQTCADFEFLIVDDKGTDGSMEIVREYMARDARIRILDNGTNQGFVRSLNHGLDQAKGEFIALLDGDDIALPHRLATQFAYLEANPDMGLVGSAAYHIDEHNALIAPHRQPMSDIEIRYELLFMPAFYHPTFMMRRSIIEANNLRYNPELLLAEDMDFAIRMSRHSSMHNLPEPLIYYRIHGASLSESRAAECTLRKQQVSYTHLRELGMEETQAKQTVDAIDLIFNGRKPSGKNIRELSSALEASLKLLRKHKQLRGTPWKIRAMMTKWTVKLIMHHDSAAFRLYALARLSLTRPLDVLVFFHYVAGMILWQCCQRSIFRTRKL